MPNHYTVQCNDTTQCNDINFAFESEGIPLKRPNTGNIPIKILWGIFSKVCQNALGTAKLEISLLPACACVRVSETERPGRVLSGLSFLFASPLW